MIPARLVVLVSGSGTLLQALIDAAADAAYGAQIVAVGADRDDTLGEQRAARAGIPTFVEKVSDHPSREEWDAALTARVAAYDPDLVVSAGFMKVLGPAFLAAHRTINSHPALLPSFPGAHGVRDALAHGVKLTGCTCHWVDSGVDTGPIIDQRAVRIEDGDTELSLHERIKVLERDMLVDVVRTLASARSRPN
ncbi:phosphoribosylglycinamide formyltransferase [Nostocoides australiense]